MLNRVIFLTLLCISSSVYASNVQDSVGTTTRAGKEFIVHKVENGETLYSLARRYHTSTEAILEENPSLKEGLKAGQNIYIGFESISSTHINHSSSPNTSGKGNTHVVLNGETLYSIARHYDVKVGTLKKWNNLSDNSISVGQTLIVSKSNASSTSPEKEVKENRTPQPSSTKTGKTHVVKASETLYSISREYNVSVSEIKKWNNLENNEISVGQTLIVGSSKAESSSTPVTKTEPKQTQPKETDTKVEKNDTPEKNSSDLPTSTKTTTATVEIDPSKPVEKKIESGIAEVIEGTAETKKYLALHRTAPIGTIMQVKNEMNNQSVFVRVVGTIPDTGDNKRILIKISKKAYDRLGAVDAKFPVVISYIP